MSEVQEKIKAMINEGNLIQVALIDTEGMVVEAAGDKYNSEILSAVLFPYHNFVSKFKEELKIEGVEEFSLKNDENQIRIILRHFSANEMKFFLLAVFPVTSPYRQMTNELIRLFYSMVKSLPGEEVSLEDIHPQELMEEEEEKDIETPSDEREKEREPDIFQADKREEEPYQEEKMEEREEIIQSEAATLLTDDMKDVVTKISEEIKKAELVFEGKPSSEISEEAIDLISYRLVKQLSSNIVEKMIQKVILQITDNLIKKEILKIRKEIESIFTA